MATDALDAKQHARELIERLDPRQIAAVVSLLEVMTEDDTELSDQDRRAITSSRDYFRQGGEGVSFERVVADSGFTMDQIRKP